MLPLPSSWTPAENVPEDYRIHALFLWDNHKWLIR